jgi:hypothetical protein
MGLEFSTMETSLGNRKLHGAIVELDNSVLAFFWEGDKPREIEIGRYVSSWALISRH